MKKVFSFFLILNSSFLICNSVRAQKEANQWYFSWLVSVDFNSGTPVATNNSAMNQYEGCSSIADKNTGAILIYSDGQNVYAGNHTLMPNGTGLTGDQSSAQSALIVPMPGNSTQYYVFTAGEFFSGGVAGYHYSIVDLTLNGGWGDVSATKNVLLYAPACEKLCAVKNAAGTGYWIATHEFTGNNFELFEVTAAGVSAPLIVPCGTVYTVDEPIGCMKFSPDGTRLATVLSGQNSAEVYDFDASTGMISNPLTITNVANNLYVYGISFSPNGSLLYAGEENTNTLSQFDLSSGNAATITASKVIVGTTSLSSAFQGMQLAPDGKLYLAHNGGFYLGVVNYPDSLGAPSNYVDTGFYLGGQTCGYGLPGFVENLFMENIAPVALFSAPNHICPGTCTNFINLSQNSTSYQWTFAGANPSTSTDINPTSICYNTPGNYSVQLIVTNAFNSDTLTLNNYITVYPSPPPQGITQNGDTLFANQGAVSYQWYHAGNSIPGATDYFYVATEGGDFNVVATDANGCEVEAAIFDVVASVQSLSGSGQFAIYPNPVLDKCTIRDSQFMMGVAVTITIYNMIGATVQFEIKKHPDSYLDEVSVDVHTLPSGIYWLEVSSGEKIFRTKFMKQ